MFTAGDIIYFENFYFKNGNTCKPKYLVVLGYAGNEIIIASLPTRTNNAPSLISKTHGCINIDDRNFNCYLFQAEKQICTNNFSFPLPTFIYGSQIEDYETKIFEQVYPIENIDYNIVGKLMQKELTAILDCIINSGSTKRKIKRLLNLRS